MSGYEFTQPSNLTIQKNTASGVENASSTNFGTVRNSSGPSRVRFISTWFVRYHCHKGHIEWSLLYARFSTLGRHSNTSGKCWFSIFCFYIVLLVKFSFIVNACKTKQHEDFLKFPPLLSCRNVGCCHVSRGSTASGRCVGKKRRSQ
jgi:hypothetical protein